MSNHYPTWWNSTLTVYNRYEDPSTRQVSWYRTVIHDCFWRSTQQKFIVDGTVVSANVTVCRIPKNDKFLERYQWEQLDSTKKSQYFTLSIDDIIVKGEVSDTINEYQSGSRSTDFLTKYKKRQGCTLVSMVAVNTDGGRLTEHYLVKGS